MELSRLIMLFFLRIAAFAVVLYYLLPHIVPSGAPQWLRNNRATAAFGICSVIGIIDQIFIYPFYRSPFRHLPRVGEKYGGQVLTESPRGLTPLTWIQKYPEHDLIASRGPFNLYTLICTGPEAFRDVLNTNSYDFHKSWGLRAFLSRILGFGLILSEDEEHKRQRKILTPAFNIRRIRELYGLMWEKTLLLLDELEKDAKKHPSSEKGFGIVDVCEWASRLTLDIIGPSAMGRDFQSLTHEDNPIAQAFIELLEPKLDGLIFFAAHFVVPEYILRHVPVRTNRNMTRISRFLHRTCEDIVRQKKTELLDENVVLSEFDILSRIMQTGEFTDELLVDQMLTFLAAGHETTANALTWACYLCAKYPHIQSRLREEIRSAISSSSEYPNYAVLESLPYLNGVCEETLRLFPTVPATIRESIRDTVVAGTKVPAGTQLILIPWASNRHPKYWGENAHEMVPERWIDTAPDGTQRVNKHGGTSTNFAEITFLHGPRSCIGRDFAKAELRCAVAGVIGKFELALQDGAKEPKPKGVITTKPEGGMYLKLRSLDGW